VARIEKGHPTPFLRFCQVLTRGDEETAALGRELGTTLQPGDVVLLGGELGAGKTVLARGIAEGLGVPPSDVSSPTFALIHEYRGRLRVFHVDLYRLHAAQEIEDLGLDELAASGVVIVEWPEKLPRAVPGAILVRIEDAGGDEREIRISERSQAAQDGRRQQD
jgi:tRNA threonylcarbamoyladenosine biosynthesis protein TsaE